MYNSAPVTSQRGGIDLAPNTLSTVKSIIAFSLFLLCICIASFFVYMYYLLACHFPHTPEEDR